MFNNEKPGGKTTATHTHTQIGEDLHAKRQD